MYIHAKAVIGEAQHVYGVVAAHSENRNDIFKVSPAPATSLCFYGTFFVILICFLLFFLLHFYKFTPVMYYTPVGLSE